MVSCVYKHNLSVSSLHSHFYNILTSYQTDCLWPDLCLIVTDPTSQSLCPVWVHQAILLPLSPLLSSLVLDQSHYRPVIICADISLPVLQCLLSLVYTGKCVLNRGCTDDDLQMLMQNLSMTMFNFEQEPLDQLIPGPVAVKLATRIPHYVPPMYDIKPDRIPDNLANACQSSASSSTPLRPRHSLSPAHNLLFPSPVVFSPPPARQAASTILHSLSQEYQVAKEHKPLVSSIPLAKKPSVPLCTALHCRRPQKGHQGAHGYKCSMPPSISKYFTGDQQGTRHNQRVIGHNSEKHQDKAIQSINLPTPPKGEHACTECTSSFSTLAKLYYHTATRHVEPGTEVYQCKFCSYTRNKTGRGGGAPLLEHLMVHTGEKDLLCKFCGEKFRARKTLANHEALHTGEKKFECDKCDARFVKLTGLKSHMKVHHKVEEEVKPLMCRFCGKVFKYGKSLANHEKSHTEEKFFL